MLNFPLRFVPFMRPMVWGGRRLGSVLNKSLPTDEPYGESWEVSDHPLHRSVIAAGPRAGQTLRQLMEEESTALLGQTASSYPCFPWLIKFLDAADWLSVQVHPDEDAIRRLLPGEGSKTEAWFVLEALPGSRIYAGLLPGTDEARVRQGLRTGTVTECLHSFEPRPGDCIFLPAGTVHAVGGGVLMAEVQQTSDATFRLFDWNRLDVHGKSRPLHIEEALACIAWDQGPIEPVRKIGRGRHALATWRYFDLSYVEGVEAFPCGGEDRLETLIVLHGHGWLEGLDVEEEIDRGQVWVLPAAMPQARCRPEPELGVLHCTMP